VSEKTYEGACAGKGRDRFTVVHEAFHGIRHRKQIREKLVHSGGLVLYRRKTIPPYRDPEWQANTFASAVLMPHPMVRQLSKTESGPSLLWAMKESFGVSLEAAKVRIDKLGSEGN
jgi:Zn-dependent peptidase ImmA (M78 family)